jgi:hypothetical protein
MAAQGSAQHGARRPRGAAVGPQSLCLTVDRVMWILHRAVGIALLALLVATASACVLGLGGCSAEEADQLSRVEHYGGAELVPEDDGLGGSGAAFSTADDPDLVLEHYRSTLEAAGWTIDPDLPSPPPGGGGDELESVSLSARRGSYGLSVSAELLGAPETNFVIHVNAG